MERKGKSEMSCSRRQEAKAKFHSLFQDYQDLVKEVVAKRDRLRSAEQRNLRLQAEVKFLRRKFQSFSENTIRIVQHGVEKQEFALPSSQMNREAGVSTSDKDTKPRNFTLIDLNEASVSNVNEAEEWHINQERTKVEMVNKFPLEGGVRTNGLSMPAADWDVGNLMTRAAKRKLSWPDQVALRV